MQISFITNLEINFTELKKCGQFGLMGEFVNSQLRMLNASLFHIMSAGELMGKTRSQNSKLKSKDTFFEQGL